MNYDFHVQKMHDVSKICVLPSLIQEPAPTASVAWLTTTAAAAAAAAAAAEVLISAGFCKKSGKTNQNQDQLSRKVSENKAYLVVYYVGKLRSHSAEPIHGDGLPHIDSVTRYVDSLGVSYAYRVCHCILENVDVILLQNWESQWPNCPKFWPRDLRVNLAV